MSNGADVPAQTPNQPHHQEVDNDPMTATNTATNTARNSPLQSTQPLPQNAEEPSTETPVVPDSSSAPSPEPSPASPPEMPQTHLTFLLVSGKRRTMSFEPDMTIGRVKELVWNAWPLDWQNERPPAPSYLRILHLGKILQDDDTLSSYKFRTSPAPPTIVHLSVRQVPLPSDSTDPLKKKKKRSRTNNSESNQGSGNASENQDEGAGCCGGCIIC